MIPSKKFLGYRTSVYTKATWVMSIVPLWGSVFLFTLVDSKWAWASLIAGVLISLVFIYSASIDHARWCPVHGSEKEEEIPTSEDNSGV